MKNVVVSGGFDPIHIGHIRLFNNARKLGDRLIVVINNDNWLKAKKKYFFMSEEEERAEIIRDLRSVDEVVLTKHRPEPDDMSVCHALQEIKPHIFANGGDRKAGNIPEYELCEKLGIEMAFNIGGEKIQSSSELVADASKDYDPRRVQGYQHEVNPKS